MQKKLRVSILIILIIIGIVQFTNCTKFIGKDTRFVLIRDNLYGYMNAQGDTIIEPQFDYAYKFSEGFATVVIDEKYGFIDDRGHLTLTPQFDKVGSFSEGLAFFQNDDDYGYVDKNAKVKY